MEFLSDILHEALGSDSSIVSALPLSGGSINRVCKLELQSGSRVLVKLSGETDVGFRAEAQGLSVIGETMTFATPHVIAVGDSPQPYLILEWIETQRIQPVFWERFGQQLAAMHGVEASNRKFGFQNDNVIGARPQINAWEDAWSKFFCQHRLGYQFDLAFRAGYFSNADSIRFDGFLRKVAQFVDEAPTKPVLIHGDLWSGNFLCNENQQPVLIDPAVSYSHNESEFSIMRMFGGFDRRFFNAYHEVRPKDAGWQERVELYALYHYLNHLNHFGRSYLSDCWRIINKYV